MGEVEEQGEEGGLGKALGVCHKPGCCWFFFFPTGNGDPSEVTVRGNDLPRTVVSKDNCGGRKGSQKEQD